MLSYCYSWTPLVIVMTVVLLALPWLGLIALFVFSLLLFGLLATLVWTVIWVPRTVTLAVRDRWRVRDTANQRAATATPMALSLDTSSVRPTAPVPVTASLLFADRPTDRPGSMA